MRPKLKLKPIDITTEGTERIYEMVRGSVDSFNLYVSDFFESVEILHEQYEKAVSAGDKKAVQETEGKINYMKMRIEELKESMERISAEMHSIVEYHNPSV